jgi:hypothetical protein
MSVIEDRRKKAEQKKEITRTMVIRMHQLKNDGYTNVRIAKLLDISESSVRHFLAHSEFSGENMVSVWFDQNSPHWKTTPEYNYMFLRQLENWCNRKLAVQGHLFLNEVFEELGIKKTTIGQKVGWLYAHDNLAHVDFHFDKNLSEIVDADGRLLLSFDVSEIIEDI